MNEWELQKKLTIEWRNNGFIFEGIKYSLTCWELMFPSWAINDNKKKWNEPSIDFIFYAQSNNTFICYELKNNIKNKKSLLSAYCQAKHRATLFREDYNIQKIKSASIQCYANASLDRGGTTDSLPNNIFSANPNIKILLSAYSFPLAYKQIVTNWNGMTIEKFKDEIKNYKSDKEFERFLGLLNPSYNPFIETKVSALQIQHSK